MRHSLTSRRAGLLAGALLMAAGLPTGGPAFAKPNFVDPGPPPALPPCTCRADGRDFQMGETICLRTSEGSRIARCVMVLNNTSWQPTTTPCPAAERLFTPRPTPSRG